jgi:hypothetical protein
MSAKSGTMCQVRYLAVHWFAASLPLVIVNSCYITASMAQIAKDVHAIKTTQKRQVAGKLQAIRVDGKEMLKRSEELLARKEQDEAERAYNEDEGAWATIPWDESEEIKAILNHPENAKANRASIMSAIRAYPRTAYLFKRICQDMFTDNFMATHVWTAEARGQ